MQDQSIYEECRVNEYRMSEFKNMSFYVYPDFFRDHLWS